MATFRRYILNNGPVLNFPLVPHRFWNERKTMHIMCDGDTFEHNGSNFKLEIVCDNDMQPPWVEHDGHGPVRFAKCYAGEPPHKNPGERVLWKDRWICYFYDWQEAIKIAKRDGWGMSDDVRRVFSLIHWRQPTKGETAAYAVAQDFKYLSEWLNDDWRWVWVRVVLLDKDGEETDEEESLGGLQSDDPASCTEVALDMAQQIIDRLPPEPMNEGDE